MLKTMRSLARRALSKVRAPKPHQIISDLEARDFGWFNKDKGELLTDFAIGPQDTVVDVGCGTGMSSEFAAVHCGAEVYAVDIDAQAIETLRGRMRHRVTPRPFHTIVSDSDPLPLPDGVATRVLCQEVMEHVEHPGRFIRELVRIGRPGARYLLTVPDPASEALQRVLAPDCYWRKPNHLRVFGRDEFEGLVRDAGLAVEKRSYYSFFWSMWWTLFWSGKGDFDFGAPGTPVLEHWNKTWVALMQAPNGPRIKKALDEFMPKSQIVIARKAA
jgi:SAM-dependent methyltransferase